MPIRELFSDHIQQECYPCGAVRDIALADFEVGVKRESQESAQLIQLPRCPVCGAVEFLVAASAQEQLIPGSFSHKHRLLVGALYAQMVRSGRQIDGLAPAALSEIEPAADVLKEWFPNGLRLELPVEVAR